jgi:hypothetical protein
LLRVTGRPVIPALLRRIPAPALLSRKSGSLAGELTAVRLSADLPGGGLLRLRIARQRPGWRFRKNCGRTICSRRAADFARHC